MDITKEQFAILHLFRCAGIGPISYKKLIARYGSALKALEALPELAKGRKSIELISPHTVEKEITALHKRGGSLVFLGDDKYPHLLAQIEDAPPVLSIIGDPEVLLTPQMAIVGNRNASAHALRFTEEIAAELAQNGYTITSGMARGVDTAAHHGALSKGLPTVAVLAGGVDHIYPSENKSLYHHIADYGCIVSEMPFGMQPTNQHFPRRNRIISGLSKGTLVTEAPIKSGSLITARLAAEQGREVFAVPGFPSDSRSSGPNLLIREGATLVEKVEDLLNNIPHHIFSTKPSTANVQPVSALPLFDEADESTEESSVIQPQSADLKNKGKKRKASTKKENSSKKMSTGTGRGKSISIESLLSTSPTSLDELIRRSGLKEADVIIQLTEMEIFGQVERSGHGYILK